MATPRKAAANDPLLEELPPEPQPSSAKEIRFQIDIEPYFVTGTVFYRFRIIENSGRAYIGDYAGQGESGYFSAEAAEAGAADWVERIRQVVDMKLNTGGSYRIVL